MLCCEPSSKRRIIEEAPVAEASEAPEEPAAQITQAGETTNAVEREEACRLQQQGEAPGQGEPSAQEGRLTVFPSVVIDEGCTYKYVLIRAKGPNRTKALVRGCRDAEYHKDAARPTLQELTKAGFQYQVLGGGRISHDVTQERIVVYGHSFGFPWADEPMHSVTAALCQSAYPGYTVEWNNKGY